MAATLPEPALPARELVRIGAALAELGDPRPGGCDLPPALVALPGGTFVMGSTAAEADAAGRVWAQSYLQRGAKGMAKRARTWPKDEINAESLTRAPFAIGRYPVTNAQYAIFIERDGYDPQAAWWDDAARAWLARDDAATQGLASWQRRTRKDQPEFWDAPTVGIARPNSPVVGVTWYEALACCRWLTQHLNDGYVYGLPSAAA